MFPTCVRLVDPNASTTVGGGTPITPSPFRSWWKLVSSVSSAVLFPDTVPIVLVVSLPLVSVFQTVYWSAPASFQATWYPVAVISAPIGAHTPNCPAVIFAPRYFNEGPEPPLSLRK